MKISEVLYVESDLRYTIIDYYDIYETTTDYYTYTSTSNYDGEGEITSAIDYVTKEDIPVVYTLQGHGETELDTYMTEAISKASFTVESLSLIDDSQIPEDCACLMILGPTSLDISESEAQLIIEYLENGGDALILSGYTTQDMPILNQYCRLMV